MDNAGDFRNSSFNVGTWINLGIPAVTELASMHPFSWFLFDLEHGQMTDAGLPGNFRAIRNDAMLIVRVAGIEATAIARVLDWGADGIMVPHISSAEQARACVEAMYYPPAGKRGFSSSVRKFGYGTRVPENINDVRPLFFAQIENAAGVQNADDIAAVNGVDVLFVGPADLRLSLSHEDSVPFTFEAALERVAAAALKHHKRAGILLRDPGQLPRMKQSGYSCIAIGSDITILRNGYQELVKIIEDDSMPRS